MGRRRGFTLIELLVVIAIIALLMSILMPVLSRVKKQANLVICQSNLKQWGIAFSAYTSDNDSYFHEGWGGSESKSNWWMDATRRYYNNVDEIRCCPMAANLDKKVDDGHVNFGVWVWDEEGNYGSYGINGWVENRKVEVSGQEWKAPLRWRTPNVKGTGNIPLLMDAPWIDCWPQHDDLPPELDNWDWILSEPYEGMGRFCKNRHEGHINCLFLDFSVKKIGLKQMWKLKWNRQFNICGPWTKCGGATAASWNDKASWMRNFPLY